MAEFIARGPQTVWPLSQMVQLIFIMSQGCKTRKEGRYILASYLDLQAIRRQYLMTSCTFGSAIELAHFGPTWPEGSSHVGSTQYDHIWSCFGVGMPNCGNCADVP